MEEEKLIHLHAYSYRKQAVYSVFTKIVSGIVFPIYHMKLECTTNCLDYLYETGIIY